MRREAPKGGRAVRFGRARGVAWREVAAAEAAAIESWAEEGTLQGDEVLKPGRVVRVGAAVLKRFEPVPGPARFLRPSAALREARLALAIRPIPAPAPIAALRAPVGSLLASEFVPGLSLAEAWEQDPSCREALARFLAEMHSSGVVHGDPHWENVLWTERGWVLLDLDSLRRGAHLLFRRRLAARHWARLVHDLGVLHPGSEPELAALYAVYLDALNARALPWDTVLALAGEVAARTSRGGRRGG